MPEAPKIVEYLEEAVDFAGLRDSIRLRHKAVSYEWMSDEQRWRIGVDVDGERMTITANFVFGCTGYYSYDRALEAVFPGIDSFKGQVIHPQWWPEDLDYSNKRVVVIGSGATTVTIVPSLAEKAAMVTQLQRSPSYVLSQNSSSAIDNFLNTFLPSSWVHWMAWWRVVMIELVFIQMLLKFPSVGRALLTSMAKKQLPDNVDVNVHFNPSYGPFQQRVCLCPEGDYFKALHRDNVEIITDIIDTVTSNGILLKSGRELEADIIVTATGLYFELLGGIKPIVDGQPVNPGSCYTWRGCMLESLPNMTYVTGYVTQSWTPGADVVVKTAIKVLKHMEKTGAKSAMPIMENSKGKPRKLLVSATSNYFVKAADRMPKVTNEGPWYGRRHLGVDMWALLFGNITDGMVYSRGEAKKDL